MMTTTAATTTTSNTEIAKKNNNNNVEYDEHNGRWRNERDTKAAIQMEKNRYVLSLHPARRSIHSLTLYF